MAKQFFDRQIKVEDDVLKYAISRMERSFLFAKKLVEELDIEEAIRSMISDFGWRSDEP